MPSYAASVEIMAPPDAVFARISDIASHPEWSADELRIEQAGPDTFRSSVRAKGKGIDAEIVVTERTPPERFGFEVTDMTGRWRHTFQLTPTTRGTRVKRTMAGDLAPAQLLLYWVVVLPVKRPNALKSLLNLKRLLESR